jgi:hypothetical protein
MSFHSEILSQVDVNLYEKISFLLNTLNSMPLTRMGSVGIAPPFLSSTLNGSGHLQVPQYSRIGSIPGLETVEERKISI